MGKTYRYDPYASEDTAYKSDEWRCEVGESLKPGRGIDPEWAMKRMSKRIACVVDELVREGTIREEEREEYVSIVAAHIVRFAREYDPDRVGKSGRKSSPLHYLRVVEMGLTCNIREYVKFRRENVRMMPIAASRKEAEDIGRSVWVGDPALSDGCRSVQALFLKMDTNTLYEMLTAEERRCLDMRLAGYTQEEIAEELGRLLDRPCDRDHVRKVVMLHIRRKARACGFFPPSEVRAGR